MGAPIGERVAVLETEMKAVTEAMEKITDPETGLSAAIKKIREFQFRQSVIIGLVAFVVGAAVQAGVKLLIDNIRF